ncbi:hypothetical protein HY637_04710 [Candidatus Woesearchaeota archaeon]|nr:hypothetical protein [Candidatus Woesearchaeota archaeon]
MDTSVYSLLIKVLKRIIRDPDSLVGTGGITKKDAAEIRATQKVKIFVLRSMATKHSFDYYHEMYGITQIGGGYIREFVYRHWQDPDIKKHLGSYLIFYEE